MSGITIGRNISGIVPNSVFGGITPVCVPIEPDHSFSDEIGGRASNRIHSLWERLGLVFLVEEEKPATAPYTEMVVNNFTAQLVLQLFSNKNIRRLVEIDQPGFVYLDKLYSQLKQRQERMDSRAAAEIAKRIISVDRITQQLFTLSDVMSGSENVACSVPLLATVLNSVVKKSETQVAETTQQLLLKKLEQTLRASVSEVDKTIVTRLEELESKELSVEERKSVILSVTDTFVRNDVERTVGEIVAEVVSSAESVTEITDLLRNRAEAVDDSLKDAKATQTLLSVGRTGHKSVEEIPTSGRIVPVELQHDIHRSVIELLENTVSDIHEQTLEERLYSRFKGMSVQEVTRVIRDSAERLGGSHENISRATKVVFAVATNKAKRAYPQTADRGMAESMTERLGSITTAVTQNNSSLHNTQINEVNIRQIKGIERLSDIVAEGSQSVLYNEIANSVYSLMQNRYDVVAGTPAVPVNSIVSLTSNSFAQAGSDVFLLEKGNTEHNFILKKNGDVFIAEDISELSVQQGDTVAGRIAPVVRNETLNNAIINHAESTVNNIQQGDTVTGRIAPVVQNETVNNAVMNHAESTVNNIQQGDTVTGRIAPVVQNETVNNAEINYAESTVNNIQQGDTVTGRIAPVVQNETVNNAVINHAESTVNNIQQGDNVIGRIAPVVQNETVNNAEINYAESTVNNIQQGNIVTGRIAPVVQNETVNNAEINHAESTVNNIQQGNIVTGRIAPVIQNETVNNAEINFAENVVQDISVAKTSKGRIKPAEQQYTLRHIEEVYRSEDVQPTETKSAQGNVQGLPTVDNSFRSKLDSKTLAALDEMISIAGIQTTDTADTIKERYTPTERSVDSRFEYAIGNDESVEVVQRQRNYVKNVGVMGAGADRIQLTQLRNAAVMRRGVGITPKTHSGHISSLVHRLSEEQEQAVKDPTKSPFTYRTVDSGENMVMLIPPTEMDRYQAESGYSKQMPPIELKQKPEQEQPQTASQRTKQKAVNARTEPVEVKTIGSIEGMSREDISKLVDKVYEQLEVRLLRERRRRGL